MWDKDMYTPSALTLTHPNPNPNPNPNQVSPGGTSKVGSGSPNPNPNPNPKQVGSGSASPARPMRRVCTPAYSAIGKPQPNLSPHISADPNPNYNPNSNSNPNPDPNPNHNQALPPSWRRSKYATRAALASRATSTLWARAGMLRVKVKARVRAWG